MHTFPPLITEEGNTRMVGRSRQYTKSTLTLPRAGTTLQPMTQRSLSNSTLAEAPNKESLARSPGSARTLSRRTPTIKGAQRPRSGSGGTAPEGVGGATGGNVLPAGS